MRKKYAKGNECKEEPSKGQEAKLECVLVRDNKLPIPEKYSKRICLILVQLCKRTPTFNGEKIRVYGNEI